MNYIEGNLIAQGLKIGIAAARFNEFIVSKLVSGAEDGLQRHGVKKATLTLLGCRVHMNCLWQQKRWQKAENTTQSFVLAPLSGVLHRILIMFVQKFQRCGKRFFWTVKFLLFLE